MYRSQKARWRSARLYVHANGYFLIHRLYLKDIDVTKRHPRDDPALLCSETYRLPLSGESLTGIIDSPFVAVNAHALNVSESDRSRLGRQSCRTSTSSLKLLSTVLKAMVWLDC